MVIVPWILDETVRTVVIPHTNLFALPKVQLDTFHIPAIRHIRYSKSP